ncbi:MAG: 50S ribosomal protein L21 [Myxococcales bacterium]|nr:50S ribosomal protein L21 [Myxococcales bacterium]MCB9547285.1 50S ribosomal protein L21 [Myxococcales bacterium]
MYAIIRTGGKQYRVAEGQTLRVEKLPGAAGDTLTLDDVLLLGGDGETRIGTPTIEGARVEARILLQDRARKILVFKKRRRKGYTRKQGHRQSFTELKVTGIKA